MKRELSIQRMVRVEGEGSLKAFCDLQVGSLRLKGLRVIEGKTGLVVSMPRMQGKDRRWYVSITATKPAMQEITAIVLSAYQEECLCPAVMTA